MLGKASAEHGANVRHNNREFIAGNVKKEKTHENITYVRQNVEDAYKDLFQKALNDYNEKQKQPCRRISDYYKHISDSNREESFYEIVVQFGDNKTASCESDNGKVVTQMLDEYIRTFNQRNPNLHIFNAVLHMDEATPHLHINFIPYYTKGRVNGLQQGVSMKAALDEQGFTAKNYKQNRLVAWELNERQCMEQILNKHGYERDNKNAKYSHMSVPEFKLEKDREKIVAAMTKLSTVSPEEKTEDNIREMKLRMRSLEQKNSELIKQRISPYKSFFYAIHDKQSYVQQKLDTLSIPYRETENGFEAQECYVDKIRQIEKEYKPVRNSNREKLRNDIDRLLMQSDSFDDLIKKLKAERYSIKYGKYISVKPVHSEQYIRVKSLGAFYSEYALTNRINSNIRYENSLDNKIKSSDNKDAFNIIIIKTVKLYTIAFKNNALPIRKKDKQKHFSWTNDIEIDKLIKLNNKVNSGATIDNLKADFEESEKTVSEKEKNLYKAKEDLAAYLELKEKIEIVFENKQSTLYSKQQAEATIGLYPNITEKNYQNVDKLINNTNDKILKFSKELLTEKEKLKEASENFSIAEKILGGTYVQHLIGEERQRRESNYIPNGLKSSTQRSI